jgi:hypothetical protein
MSDAKARPLKSDNSDNDSVPDSDNDAPSRKSYSSGENEGGSRPGSSLGTNKSNKKKGENRQSRKSKDAALQEIYSESNRMLRESKVRHSNRYSDHLITRHPLSFFMSGNQGLIVPPVKTENSSFLF